MAAETKEKPSGAPELQKNRIPKNEEDHAQRALPHALGPEKSLLRKRSLARAFLPPITSRPLQNHQRALGSEHQHWASFPHSDSPRPWPVRPDRRLQSHRDLHLLPYLSALWSSPRDRQRKAHPALHHRVLHRSHHTLLWRSGRSRSPTRWGRTENPRHPWRRWDRGRTIRKRRCAQSNRQLREIPRRRRRPDGDQDRLQSTRQHVQWTKSWWNVRHRSPSIHG